MNLAASVYRRVDDAHLEDDFILHHHPHQCKHFLRQTASNTTRLESHFSSEHYLRLSAPQQFTNFKPLHTHLRTKVYLQQRRCRLQSTLHSTHTTPRTNSRNHGSSPTFPHHHSSHHQPRRHHTHETLLPRRRRGR